MQDRVADVLAQRAALDRGAGAGLAISVVLHGGLTALAVYAALHAPAPRPTTMLNIKLAPMTQAAPAKPAATKSAAKPAAPKIEEPKPKIDEPKPEPVQTPPPKPPEKNTVPLSPFGRSTKKGSETPAVVPPAPAPPGAAATSTAPEIAVGGSGVTGLEGGDFPYTLYITGMQRKIGSNWLRPQVTGNVGVVIYFRIQRDGTISEARVETPSGIGTFDRAALSAVRSSSPLNPLPFGYQGSYLGVHLTFK
jgi:periplasmic protein TonB